MSWFDPSLQTINPTTTDEGIYPSEPLGEIMPIAWLNQGEYPPYGYTVSVPVDNGLSNNTDFQYATVGLQTVEAADLNSSILWSPDFGLPQTYSMSYPWSIGAGEIYASPAAQFTQPYLPAADNLNLWIPTTGDLSYQPLAQVSIAGSSTYSPAADQSINLPVIGRQYYLPDPYRHAYGAEQILSSGVPSYNPTVAAEICSKPITMTDRACTSLPVVSTTERSYSGSSILQNSSRVLEAVTLTPSPPCPIIGPDSNGCFQIKGTPSYRHDLNATDYYAPSDVSTPFDPTSYKSASTHSSVGTPPPSALPISEPDLILSPEDDHLQPSYATGYSDQTYHDTPNLPPDATVGNTHDHTQVHSNSFYTQQPWMDANTSWSQPACPAAPAFQVNIEPASGAVRPEHSGPGHLGFAPYDHTARRSRRQNKQKTVKETTTMDYAPLYSSEAGLSVIRDEPPFNDPLMPPDAHTSQATTSGGITEIMASAKRTHNLKGRKERAAPYPANTPRQKVASARGEHHATTVNKLVRKLENLVPEQLARPRSQAKRALVDILEDALLFLNEKAPKAITHPPVPGRESLETQDEAHNRREKSRRDTITARVDALDQVVPHQGGCARSSHKEKMIAALNYFDVLIRGETEPEPSSIGSH